MKNQYKAIFLLLISGLAFFACNEALNVNPEEVLLQEDYLGADRVEARSALFGVLGQVQKVSEQYMVLGELRADLMDVTENSIDELRQINEHNVQPGNKLTDPTELFAIVNNCNFALQGIDTAAYDNELVNVYASILRVRSWAQLQLAINFGKLPFVTQPFSSVDDLNKNYPILTLEQTVDSLIAILQPYQIIDNVSTYQNSLNFSIYNLIPDKDVQLGDLYLWAGDYEMAATAYKQFLDRYVSGGGNKYNLTSQYQISSKTSTSSYTDNWLDIYAENVAGNEVIRYVPFSKQYRQPNTFYDEFISGYQLKSSDEIMKKWATQVRVATDLSTGLGDYRGELSTIETGAGLGIRKYQYNYLILCRAANVYLRYAEAINRAGFPLHALYLLNQGPKDDPTEVGAPRFVDNAAMYLNFIQTQYYTVNGSGQSTNGNLGIRGRVGLAPLELSDAITTQDSILQVERLILDESAMETAFEGNRWSDLVRISLRNNDNSILANAVAAKFEAVNPSLAASVAAKLMERDNWFLNLNEEENFIPVP